MEPPRFSTYGVGVCHLVQLCTITVIEGWRENSSSKPISILCTGSICVYHLRACLYAVCESCKRVIGQSHGDIGGIIYLDFVFISRFVFEEKLRKSRIVTSFHSTINHHSFLTITENVDNSSELWKLLLSQRNGVVRASQSEREGSYRRDVSVCEHCLDVCICEGWCVFVV